LANHHNPPQVINAAAPDPLINKVFMREFRSSLHVGIGIGAPAWTIKLGTAVLGVDSELVLRGMHVVSDRTEAMGFQFEYPTLASALSDLAATKS
jgi:NAD dependent epimerase/dehydratase family enzyme